MVFKGVIVSTTGQYLAIFCRKTSKQTRSSCQQMPVLPYVKEFSFCAIRRSESINLGAINSIKCLLLDVKRI